MDGIFPSSIFYVPKPAAILLKINGSEPGQLGDIHISKGGRGEFYGPACVLAIKIKRVAEQLSITLVWGKPLPEFIRLFCTHSKGCPRQEAYNTVSRSIYKIRCGKKIFRRILTTKSPNHLYFVPCTLFEIMDCGVEQ